MKKYVVAVTAAIFMPSSYALAAVDIHVVNSTWRVIEYTDDFDDSKSCAVTLTRGDTRGYPNLFMFIKHSRGPHTLLYANGSIDGIGLRYRVDKNQPVLIGYEYTHQSNNDFLSIRGEDMVDMIAAFKRGNQVAFRVTSGNQFVESGTDRVSLSGFTRAYNLAKDCNF